MTDLPDELKKISEKDYKSYLKEIEKLIDLDPEESTDESKRLKLLALAVEDFEKNRFFFDRPTQIEAIKFRMEEMAKEWALDAYCMNPTDYERPTDWDMQEQKKVLENGIEDFSDGFNACYSIMKERIEIYEKALEFYSVSGNYEAGPSSWVDRSQPLPRGLHTCDLWVPVQSDAGKRALEALKKGRGEG